MFLSDKESGRSLKQLERKVIWEYEFKPIQWYSMRAIVMTNTPNRVTTRIFAGLNITSVKTAINWDISVTVKDKGFGLSIRY